MSVDEKWLPVLRQWRDRSERKHADPKPARVVGLFPDADSALASLPACHFTAETCAEVSARWESRPRVAVETVALLDDGLSGDR